MSLLPGVLYYGITGDDIELLQSFIDEGPEDEGIAFLADEYGLVTTEDALNNMIEAFRHGVSHDGHYLLGEDVAAPYLGIMEALGMDYRLNALQSGAGGGNP